jgi:energy-coupling factor transport system permease protein
VLSDSLSMLSYEGASSPAAALDARFKVTTGLAAGIGILVAHDAWQFVALALLIASYIGAARVPPATLWGSLKPVFLFMIVGGGLIALETKGPGWSLGFAHVSRAGLELAGRLSVQLTLLLAVTTTVTYTTPPLAIAGALRRLFGFLRYVKVPVEDMTTMLTIAITFIPLMSREVDRYLTARAARGANPHRLGIWSMLGDMLVPLLQANLQRGEELALALDTRLYGYGKRTHRYDDDAIDPRSIVVLLIAVAAIGGTIALL